jgi:glutaredoxin
VLFFRGELQINWEYPGKRQIMAFYNPEKYRSAVFLFTLSTCIHCKKAKKLLSDIGVRFGYVDVDQLSQNERSAALSEMSKYNPSETFPTLIIGGKVIVGDREDDIRQALARLAK